MKVQRLLIKSGFSLQIQTPKGEKILPATIPGSIHTDLIAAGVIGDIRTTGTEVEQEWIRNADSSYRTTISAQLPAIHELNFLGLDTLATVSINGQQRLVTENMHRSYSIEVDATQEIDLQIDFKAPLPEALKREESQGIYPNPYNMPYNYFRKMACGFGWDWGPITGTSGVWKPIVLTSWDAGILDLVTVIGDFVDAVPTLKVVTLGRGTTTKVKIRVSGNHEAEFESTINTSNTFQLPGFDLWQPRGFGKPTLYTVQVELLSDTGEVVDEATKRVGFRSVTLDQSNFDGRQMFAIVVNGKRVWARGVNWIPDDPFPHRVTRADYAKKIEDLYSVEVNAIRVWGGGIYESDDFYDLCDEKGIIVWQDFLFACAAYPEIESFIEEVKAEATEAVNRLTNHPSLVLWCGGNECIEGFQHWDWKEPLAGKAWGSKYYFDILPTILKELDGTRAYIPGSPFSTLSEDVKDFASGTNHIWDVWNERGYQRYEEYSPSFAAEFGYNGPGSWRTLTTAINEKDLDSRDPKLATHQKAFDGMDKVAAGLKREFAGEYIEGPQWYFAAQLVQARAVEVGLKHFRSQFDTCSGSMLWQYNDMWPAISWAVLDSSASRKLSWYAMREAYRPRLLHLSGENRKLVIINDTAELWRDQLYVVVLDEMGAIIETRNIAIAVAAKGRQVINLGLSLESNGYVVAQLGDIRTARRMLDKPIARINPVDAQITAVIDGLKVNVKVTAQSFIHEFSLLPELVAHDEVVVSAQRLTILPNETAYLEIAATHAEDAKLISKSMDQITWSLNRLVASPTK
ncbi:MAG: glycoside hydrolase family 2 TIM barrel-domain containing protein [Actinomycetes bacterium]